MWPYLLAVLMFLVLILIHEFGHFIAAKADGVRVNEFAIGFGPKLLRWQWGETVYKINLIPFGGYCAMEGEEEASEDSRAFCNKKAWRRAIVIVAGAVFNLILGFVIIGATLLPKDRFATTQVAAFAENAISDESGLMVGDEIIEVNGRRVFTTIDMGYAFTGIEGDTIDLTVLRGGSEVFLDNVKFKTEQVDGINVISHDFWVAPQEKTVGSFLSQTFKTGLSYGRVVWFSLVDLVTGKYGISAVSGPVGVTEVIGSAAKQSISNLWPIMALITINLGIFNLLPLPALDGGRLIFILIEMIFRKKVPEKYESWVHAAGFALLIGFMLLITAKDIWALVV